jgi:acetyl esterase
MNKVDVLGSINPQMRAVIQKSNELVQDAYATDAGFDVMRRNYNEERRFWNEGGPIPYQTINDVLATRHGEVAIRRYVPASAQPVTSAQSLPAILYIHGGGFVLGNLDTHDRIMRILAEQTGAIVVGIDYALAPEARFPIAIEQCADVARHLREHGQSWGIDGNDLSFAGDSGGAMLSLATALYLRDQDKAPFKLRSLLLFYGLFGLKDSPSQRLLGGSWDGLTKEDLQYYYDCYLAKPQDSQSPYFDCLSADLSEGVPPCYIAAATLDPLHDDSTTLAAMLTNHGITSRLEVFDGVLHAFLHNSRMLGEAQTALEHSAAFFREMTP